MNPIISIVTINFNNSKGLQATQKSIHDQSYLFYEWIVIDGASTDDSLKSLSFCKKKPDTLISEPDKGIYDAMKKGLDISKGEFVLFLNSGDFLLTDDSLLNLSKTLHTSCDVYFCDTLMIGKNSSWTRKARPLSSANYSVPALQQSTLYKCIKLKKLSWPVEYKICGDFYLAAQLLITNATSEVCNIKLSAFELGGVSTVKFKDLADEALKIQRKTLKLSWLFCTYSYLRRITTGLVIFTKNKLH